MKRYFFLSLLLSQLLLFSENFYPKPFSLHRSLVLDTSTSRIYLQNGEGHDLASDAGRFFNICDLTESHDFYNIKHLHGKTLMLFEGSDYAHTLLHYFHLLEHLVGIYALYGHDHAQSVKQIMLLGDGKTSYPGWEGPNNINKHLMKGLFPNAEIFTYDTLKARYRDKVLFIEEGFFSDRALTYSIPECLHPNIMLGSAYKSFNPDVLENMSNRMHAYTKSQNRPSAKLRVTYIMRNAPRHINTRQRKVLFKKIKELHDVEFKAYYLEKKSYQNQIEIMKNTDVLMGVHGNGFSHLLFLPKDAAVVEVMPEGCLMLGYRLFSNIKKLRYYGVQSGKYIMDDNEAYKRGYYGDPNYTVKSIDTRLILDILRKERDLKRKRR
ncbi:hypothetical protein COB11_03605 [Candidatus Aerophobetes bacterium]|uniref:EGF domain-specific O-linked N-acetylglucosamine transferase n=1 Tax=Aerophobetes bacterium TaxID=2030807 RepID=A0A2A4YIF7_UNCAE|nr:MAG: hypothetical protein COB11_03605 [Candidatus Aerophobetes bacterium]